MGDPYLFAEVLGKYVQRSAYSTGQLASLSTLPKTTIGNWLEGRVKRPRHWQGVVELAAAMRLTELEANELLASAQHPSIQELRPVATDQEKELFAFWQTAVSLPPAPVPFQAISLPPYFVGRKPEQSALQNALQKEEHTAVYCLHGMAGVGKTSLAAQMAYQMRPHFADGVLWARLDSSDTMSILATFADAYQRDVTQYHDIASRSRMVRDLLMGKQTLLILDNAQTSAQIEPLLPPTGRCAILVTTRRQDLAILAGAKWFAIRPFTPNKANSLHLFAQILGKQRVQSETEFLQQMAEELGHLPLALVIAASRLAYEPGWQTGIFGTRLQNIKQRLQALRFESQNVRRSFQLSYDLLDSDGQYLFALTGLLGRQDFATEVLHALSKLDREQVDDILRQLFSLSLLQNGTNGRFQLHPLLHDFARSLEQAKPLTTQLVTYWSDFVANHKDSFALLKQELGHIEVALETAVQEKINHQLWHLLNNLMPYFVAQGLYEQAEQYLEKAETAVLSTKDNVTLGKIYLLKAQMARHRQDLDDAEAYLETGRQQIQGDASSPLLAYFLAELGIIQTCRSQFAEGKKYLSEALTLARQEPSDQNLVLNLLTELGILSFMNDEDALAEQYYREGLPLALAHENKTHAVMLLKSLGALHHLEQDRVEAKRLFIQGFELAQEIEFRKGIMVMSNNLGVLAFLEEDADAAQNYFQMGFAEAERLSDSQGMGLLLNNLAKLNRHDRRFAEAQRYFERALFVAQAKNAPQTRMTIYKELGILAAQQGDMETAVSHFEQAHSLAETISTRWLVEVKLAWGTAYLLQGNIEAGASLFEEVQNMIKDNKAPDAFREKVEQGLHQIEDGRNGRKLSVSFPPEHLIVFI